MPSRLSRLRTRPTDLSLAWKCYTFCLITRISIWVWYKRCQIRCSARRHTVLLARHLEIISTPQYVKSRINSAHSSREMISNNSLSLLPRPSSLLWSVTLSRQAETSITAVWRLTTSRLWTAQLCCLPIQFCQEGICGTTCVCWEERMDAS